MQDRANIMQDKGHYIYDVPPYNSWHFFDYEFYYVVCDAKYIRYVTVPGIWGVLAKYPKGDPSLSGGYTWGLRMGI